MNTLEHEKIGQSLTVKKRGNPYIHLGDEGEGTKITLMYLDDHLPKPLDLKLSIGELIAMPDFFTDPHWDMELDLGSCNRYQSVEEFGWALIEREITSKDKDALLGCLADLAKPGRHRRAIDTVFKIAHGRYFPIDSVNELIRQAMYFLRVRHYDRKLDRNQTHFTPWSIRVYVIGHAIALDLAQTAYQLHQNALICEDEKDHDYFTELAHRFHTMSLEIELYTAHYLSDHFAAGHLSQVGDLRVELPKKFGILGGLAVNSMHNELNRVGLRTKKPYDPSPDATDPPLDAYGDNDFERCENTFNREDCIHSLQASLDDIEAVLDGKPRPKPSEYGALNFLPDVDDNSRQPEPMFLLQNDAILVRGQLRKIRRLGPDDYEDLQQDPVKWGYKTISGRFHLLSILFKLRLVPFYQSEVVPLSAQDLKRIEEQESNRQADRLPMPTPPCESNSITAKPEKAFFNKGLSPYISSTGQSASLDSSEDNACETLTPSI